MTEPERPADYVELIIKGSWLNESKSYLSLLIIPSVESGASNTPKICPASDSCGHHFQRWLKRMQSIAL